MKLMGKVVKVESSSIFVDKVERVLVKIDGYDCFHDSLSLRNEDGWKLDDEVELYLWSTGMPITDAVPGLKELDGLMPKEEF